MRRPSRLQRVLEWLDIYLVGGVFVLFLIGLPVWLLTNGDVGVLLGVIGAALIYLLFL